jgi:phage tail-like protein
VTSTLDHYNFRLEHDGACVAAFAEVSGITMDGATDRETACKRGLLIGSDIWDWFAANSNGTVQRRTLTLSLRAEDGGEAARWLLLDAFVTNIEQPTFDPEANVTAVELLALSCAELRRA